MSGETEGSPGIGGFSERDNGMTGHVDLEQTHQQTQLMALLEDLRRHGEDQEGQAPEQIAKRKMFDLHELFRRQKDIFPDQKKHFEDMRETVSAAVSSNEVPDERHNDVIAYLEKHKEDWEGQPDKPDAAANVELFTNFLNVFTERDTPKAVKEPVEQETIGQEASEALWSTIVPSPEEFAQYEIPLEYTADALRIIAKKEHVSIKDLAAFYIALTFDISQEEGKYSENPKWRMKEAIVRSADKFNQEHRGDPDRKKYMQVNIAEDGSIDVGWYTGEDNETTIGDYKLTDGSIEDPNSISFHLYNLDQFYHLGEALKGAERVTNRLQVTKWLRRKIDKQDRIHAVQLVQRFGGDQKEALMALLS